MRPEVDCPVESWLPAMTRCAGCHDQCLAATAEAAASGDQTLVVSRVATLGLRLLDGRMEWSAETVAPLFRGLNDGIQAEVCIFRTEGHRIEPYLRALRAEAVRRGLAPGHVRAAQDLIRESGNVLGVSVPPSEPPSPGTVTLLHDAATTALDPRAASAACGLLARAGIETTALWVSSCGAIEADLGLVDESERATAAMVDAITGAAPSMVVSSDPVLVARAQEVLAGPGWTAPILHLAQVLDAAGMAFAPRHVRVTVHDPGALARPLDASTVVRRLLGRVAGLELREPVNTGRLAASDGPLGPYPDAGAAEAIARRRMDELRRTGADMVVTSSPYSLANLRGVADGMQVEDLAVFLDDVGAPR